MQFAFALNPAYLRLVGGDDADGWTVLLAGLRGRQGHVDVHHQLRLDPVDKRRPLHRLLACSQCVGTVGGIKGQNCLFLRLFACSQDLDMVGGLRGCLACSSVRLPAVNMLTWSRALEAAWLVPPFVCLQSPTMLTRAEA